MDLISGHNGRRVIHGALNIQSGELASLVRGRSRTNDSQAFGESLGQFQPKSPKLI
ncbi:MAG TPA: hypothetical protein VH540_00265 [Ktedonobacterales bacterium]